MGMVIQSMLDSFRTIMWTLVMLIIIMYCVAVVVTTFVAGDEYAMEYWADADMYVGSVYKSMITVMQLITFDSWCLSILRPMFHVRPLTCVFLFMASLFCSFGALNVILGVMVENTMKNSKESAEIAERLLNKTEQQIRMKMGEEFYNAGVDAEGNISYANFSKLIKS